LRFIDEYLEEFFLFPSLVFIVLALGVEVFRRYVLNSPGKYTSELATFAFFWTVYIGISYAVKKRKHITLDLLPEKLNKNVNFTLEIITNVIQLVFFCFMVVQAINLIRFDKAVNMVSDAMQAPLWIVLLCFPIGFGLGVIRLIQVIINIIKEFRT